MILPTERNSYKQGWEGT